MTTETGKIFAVGDIHGCLEKLNRLLDRLPYVPGRDRLVFLGDYLNRGPDSAGVLDLLCTLRQKDPDLIALLGNHEYLLLEYHRSGDPLLLPYLRTMGVEATMASYGLQDISRLQSLDFLPAAHLAFLDSLLPFWETDDYIFVHAGLDPSQPLAANDLTTLCESRDSFFTSPLELAKTVVFGHTPFTLPLATKSKIGIDTGAVYDNLLTAVELPGRAFYHA